MDLMDLVAERVKILYQGIWKEKQVKTIIKKRAKRIPGEMAKFARERFLARKTKNPALFDGNVFCLDMENSEIKPGRIVLRIAGTIKYSVYDAIRKEYIEKFGWKDFPIGMGSSLTVLSSDGKILMQRTLPHVDFPDKISVIGGIYDEGLPFDCIRRELEEEIGIKKREIKDIRLTGISSRLENRINYELNFIALVSLTSRQIAKRQKTASDKEGDIFFIDCSPKTVKEFIRENRQKIASTSFACLVLFGRYLWGRSWSIISK